MSTQIALRLPDDLVAALDAAVVAGQATSRADLVGRAVRHELRRQRAVEELDRLTEDDPELDAWVTQTRRPTLDD